MPKCLFIGCSPAQVPYLRAAVALGFDCIVTDRDPLRAGAAHEAGAVEFATCGYDDINGMLAIAEEVGLGPDDKVFTAAMHHAHEAASAVAYQVGIDYPTPDAIDRVVCKMRLREVASRWGWMCPDYHTWFPGVWQVGTVARGFVKSDYGKSPRYCWPPGTEIAIPHRRDSFFRRAFLEQDSVEGHHWRIIATADGEIGSFYRPSTAERWISFSAPCSLGREVADMATALGRLVLKVDVIDASDEVYLLDLGIDPPQRLRLYWEAQGEDFAAAYVRHHLTRERWAFPLPEPGTIIDMEKRQCVS